jgi:hypothetical protein
MNSTSTGLLQKLNFWRRSWQNEQGGLSMARTTLAEKIAKLEAELKETKAAANRVKRKERNKQLMALGIYLERLYKERSAEGREKMRSQLESAALDSRIKATALDGFSRIDEEAPAESQGQQGGDARPIGQDSGKVSGD